MTFHRTRIEDPTFVVSSQTIELQSLAFLSCSSGMRTKVNVIRLESGRELSKLKGEVEGKNEEKDSLMNSKRKTETESV